ncbi:Compactin diketide synthase mokB [Hondaea fermentalgiana]|uniref:Compactin diketide synthase mokB n=1 Tax=Hondaea fermentalgiana TaxID=2315210 RepID=A0A2R5GRC1_9STRA|nr:Compactin diketide synthase mokB [Hondaea fermentalgiana]|eukprot:GBG32859.1 Compactin diketide synthase mokB [Hondaea fermentalgiana]
MGQLLSSSKARLSEATSEATSRAAQETAASSEADVYADGAAAAYDADAEGLRLFEVQLGVLREQAWWPAPDAGGLVSLDYGCGPARLLCGLGDALAPGSCGLDPSESMLELARSRAADAGLRDVVDFRNLDPAQEGAELESFAGKADLVIVCFVMYFVDDKEKIFGHLCRSLKSGGHLFVAEYENDVPQAKLETWTSAWGCRIASTLPEEMLIADIDEKFKINIFVVEKVADQALN